MLVSEFVEVGLRGNKKLTHYREKGYEIPTKIDKYKRIVIDYSKKLFVKIEDMPIYSEAKVTVKCDYQEDGCKDIYQKNVSDYFKNNINSTIHKDCCSNRKCQARKTSESNIINYGFEYHINQPEYIEKQQEIILNKYGTKNIFSSEYFIKLNKNIIKEKYGVDNVSQNNEIKIKKAKTLYKNETIATSRQQRYIHHLFGGILNYSNNTPNLDIAFPEVKIYTEYNGSGHDLSVKRGKMTQEEFNNKEIKRYQFLKSNGWKLIKITSSCDYLPSDEVLLNEYNKALEWFKSDDKGHWHFNIDIGNKINDAKYGKLRRIKEKDLKEVG